MNDKQILSQAACDLDKIRATKPLIHHITNFVVMNETANLTICLGALPVMAHAREEVEEMVSFAGALVLNIGTLTPELIDSMILAGKKANELRIPVVLDPVGAGATLLRTESAKRIMSEVDVDILRGNSAELSILGGVDAQIKGVESIFGADNLAELATSLAQKTGTIVAITGKEDFVSDGRRTAVISNGHELLSKVTGTGCMSTTAVAGFAAVEDDLFIAAVGGLTTFGVAAEKASIGSSGPGSFHMRLYDCLTSLMPSDIEEMGKVILR